jgi:hypothetical protein
MYQRLLVFLPNAFFGFVRSVFGDAQAYQLLIFIHQLNNVALFKVGYHLGYPNGQ